MIVRFLRHALSLGDRVLGMNARNLDYIYRLNPRKLFPRADDKLRTNAILAEAGVPVPRRLALFETRRDLIGLEGVLRGIDGFALKPAQGFGGKGILVLRRATEVHFVSPGARGGDVRYDAEAVRDHVIAILAGVYSLERLGDRAFFEELLEPEPVLARLAFRGLPDIRIIVCEGKAIMGMVRIPTRDSAGKANLHQGALGLGVDMRSGRTTHAVRRGRPADRHPDTGSPLSGLEVPSWDEAIDLSLRAASAIGLGYLGVDVVVDSRRGPLVIEVNARPGLAIQLANMAGLAAALGGGSR